MSPAASESVLTSAADFFPVIALVFGGCCSNVFALEAVLKSHPSGGLLLTFIQFLYVALQTLPTQLTWQQPPTNGTATTKLDNHEPPTTPAPPTRSSLPLPLPHLKPRAVPVRRWIVQVALFLAVSLMNNAAFGFRVPVPIHIIFRSGGLCVSMAMGYAVGKKRYSAGQVLSVLLITIGITLATLSTSTNRSTPAKPPGGSSTTPTPNPGISDTTAYAFGIALLAGALVVSALMGLWQERTYALYGAVWEEGLFYSHALSLPFFLPFLPTIAKDFSRLALSPPTALPRVWLLPEMAVPSAWVALAMNVVTQGLCIRGVNKLTARVSAVTVNLILTIRKAVSLGISVGYYGTGFTPGLGVGSAMVLAGTMLYSVSNSPSPSPTKPTNPTTPVNGEAGTTRTYDIVVKRDDSANNPAEKVEPEVMLQRMKVHATEVRERRSRAV